jgi:prephenate dehydrogenase
LTPTPKTSKAALSAVKEIVSSLGAEIIEIDPQKHDLAVAGISHMPLAVAAALVNASAGDALMKKLAASGFRDTTRIASGDPELGADMFTTNKAAVLKTLSAFKKALSSLEKLIKQGNASRIKKELAKAKTLRDSIYG